MRILFSLLLIAGCSDRSIDDGSPMGGAAAPEADPACATLDQRGCAARADCHAIFTAEEPCDNLCCDSHFHACVDGARADCGGDVACNSAPPTCVGAFAAAVADGCWAGCVARYECQGYQGTCGEQTGCPTGRGCVDARGELTCDPAVSPCPR
jgi:hypothetical protein